MSISYNNDAFYFGCIGSSGHFWFNCQKRPASYAGFPADFPFRHSTGEGMAIDGLFPPKLKAGQVEGVATLWRGAGWTVLSFWDRSVDHRGNSNSNFVMRGTFTFAEAVDRAMDRFPFIWERFTFEVVDGFPQAERPEHK